MAYLACVGNARVNWNNFFDGSTSLIGSGRDRGRGFGFCSIRKSRNNNCNFSCNKWKRKWSRTPLYYSLVTRTSLVEQEVKSLVTEIGIENDNDGEVDVDVVLKSRPKPMLRAGPSPAPTRKVERPDLVRSTPHNKANNNATPTSLVEQEAKSLMTEIGNENDNDGEVDVDVVLKSRPKPMLRAAPSPAPTRKVERPDLVRSTPHNKANNNATPTSLVEQEAKSLMTEIGNENDNDGEVDVDVVLKSRPKSMLRAAPSPAPTRKVERPDLVRSTPHNKANNNATPTSLLEQEAKSLVTEIGNENDNDVEADVKVDVDVVVKSRPKTVLRAPPSPAPTQKLERPDLGPRWARSAPHNKADNNASGLISQPPNNFKTSNNVWKKGNPTSYVSYVPRVPASTSTTEFSQEKENLDEVISQEKKNLDKETIKKEERSSMRMPMLARPQPLKPQVTLTGKPIPMTMRTSSSKVPSKKQVVLKDLGAAPRNRQVILKDVGAALNSKREITMKSGLVNEDVNVSPSATVAGVAASPTSSRLGKAEGSGSPFRSKDKLKSRPGSALRKSKTDMSDTGEGETDLNFSSGRKGKKFNKATRKAARFAAAEAEAPVKVEILEVGKQGMSVVELAHNLAVTEGEILTSLFMKGISAFVTQTLDKETVKLVCKEHDVEVIESADVKADDMAKKTDMLDEDDLDKLQTRPPILTIMGHVDHGKTTLLDYIRKSKVAASEAGGITQGIGAYTVVVPVDDNLKPCVFLDTPGHEAFSAMRARGAKVTDIAIIVVAADDGVRPQTNEAIAHAKAADVPIVVAINKIDKEGASPERVMQELSSIGLMPEEWGGDVPMVPVSALTGQNVNELLETVLLVAELQELKANPYRNSKGTVIEASLHNSRGPLATFLVQNGTLKKGDIVVCGESYGKIRALFDDTGASVDKASPSMAVQVIGLSNVPIAGDEFETVNSLDNARERAEECALKLRDKRLYAQSGEAQVTLSSLGIAITEGKGIGSNRHQLNIILKVDVQGSVAAIREALDTLPQDTVNLRFLMEAVGDINASDVNLASASEAIIVGFNVRVLAAAQAQAENQSVEIRMYRVIYELVDDMRNAMEGLLKPVEEQVPIGSAEVRAVFNNGSGHAAGCMATEGKVVKGCGIRVVRNGKVVHTGTLDSLRRVKEAVKEISAGMECGIALRDFDDWDVGDIIETFSSVAKQCTLEEASASMTEAVAASVVQL